MKVLWRLIWTHRGVRNVEWFPTRKEAFKRGAEMLNLGYAIEGIVRVGIGRAKVTA